MTAQAASTPQTGPDRLRALLNSNWAEVAPDPMIAQMVDNMKRDGVPVTRENYIARAYGDTPEPWTVEHEADLPYALQDWSRFK